MGRVAPIAASRRHRPTDRGVPGTRSGEREKGVTMTDSKDTTANADTASPTPAAPPAQAEAPAGAGAAAPPTVSTTPAAPPAQADDMVIAAAQVSDRYGVLAEGAVAVEGDHALVVARFADTASARSVYDGLLAAELDDALHIDGVLVVKADDDGRIRVEKMTEHSTRTGLMWGVVGGVVAAVFLPATLVAGAVALGTAGAAAGKARNLKRRLDVERELAGVITAGTSGILALVTAKDAPAVEAKMPQAEEVKTVPVDEETAGAIKEAAAEAEAVAPSGA